MLSATLFLLTALFALPALLFLLYYPALSGIARVLPKQRPLFPWNASTKGATPASAVPAAAAPANLSPASERASLNGQVATARLESSLSVALVLVASRRDSNLDRKIAELVAYSERRSIIELFVGLDGNEAPTNAQGAVTWIGMTPRQGKNAVLRKIHQHAMADVLVFTDVDARLEPACLDAVLAPFADAHIGAVTGRRQIVDDTGFGQAQAGYADLDNEIRKLEMRCVGSVTTCEGKLYAVRRNLLDGNLPDDVSDDLHYGLGAVAGGSRLVFEPEAIARIGRPARDFRHEFARRRRVTCRGLSTLRARRELLDPRRHGRFAIALMINKLFRRLACPSALLAALSLVAALLTLPVSAADILPGTLAIGVIGVLALLMLAIILTKGRGRALAYLALGMLSTSCGVVDYLRGHRVAVWESVKSGGDAHDNVDVEPSPDQPAEAEDKEIS